MFDVKNLSISLRIEKLKLLNGYFTQQVAVRWQSNISFVRIKHVVMVRLLVYLDQPKVLMQGKLIAVAYTLCTY